LFKLLCIFSLVYLLCYTDVQVAFVDHAVLLSKLCAALASLSGADLTLAQFAHTPEQQVSYVALLHII
jgi:hypothetical protein